MVNGQSSQAQGQKDGWALNRISIVKNCHLQNIILCPVGLPSFIIDLGPVLATNNEKRRRPGDRAEVVPRRSAGRSDQSERVGR